MWRIYELLQVSALFSGTRGEKEAFRVTGLCRFISQSPVCSARLPVMASLSDNNDTGSRLRAQRYARVPFDKRQRREEHFFIPLNTIKELQACF